MKQSVRLLQELRYQFISDRPRLLDESILLPEVCEGAAGCKALRGEAGCGEKCSG